MSLVDTASIPSVIVILHFWNLFIDNDFGASIASICATIIPPAFTGPIVPPQRMIDIGNPQSHNLFLVADTLLLDTPTLICQVTAAKIGPFRTCIHCQPRATARKRCLRLQANKVQHVPCRCSAFCANKMAL
ncbi:hypothetical protein RirG_077350 [Rhizophagus irregularis DAOM 197198w]|uniref:Uncharacterized protein n=1 Tax=Rhizophagus irregularis (strain DAOM 197198w) TaxID=1432141 RepID=A0A015LG60_RHIIW|nr:hypothetical protein RirG_077350 [Rhizophagus irregularis DAOM 197198w]